MISTHFHIESGNINLDVMSELPPRPRYTQKGCRELSGRLGPRPNISQVLTIPVTSVLGVVRLQRRLQLSTCDDPIVPHLVRVVVQALRALNIRLTCTVAAVVDKERCGPCVHIVRVGRLDCEVVGRALVRELPDRGDLEPGARRGLEPRSRNSTTARFGHVVVWFDHGFQGSEGARRVGLTGQGRDEIGSGEGQQWSGSAGVIAQGVAVVAE